MMMKRLLPALLLVLLTGAARAQSTAIELSGQGPYYRLPLPLAIHGLAAHGDLRDVRVVNAAGHAVPRAWLRDEAVEPRITGQDAPVFALPRRESATADAADDAAIILMVQPDGTLALRAQAARASAESAEATQWIIDASRVQGSLLQARMALAPQARGVFPFRLEASDDLRQWRAVGGEEQLVRLTQGGQTIERLAVDLGHLRTRFLRLTWTDARNAPPLAGVGLDSVEEFEPVAPLEWLPAIKPGRCADDHCDYPLPRGLPLQGLRIDLPEPNTLAQISISGLRDDVQAAPRSRPIALNPLYSLRHRRQVAGAAPSREAPLLDTIIYRLSLDGHDVRSPTLALDGRPYTRLRLRTQGPVSALGATPPSIAVAGAPRTLVFLAQGAGPFLLRWDAVPAADAVAPMALSTLIPGYVATRPLLAGQATATLPDAAATVAQARSAQNADAAPGPKPERKWLLWGALGLGLLLLAGMAWSLFGRLRKAQADGAD